MRTFLFADTTNRIDMRLGAEVIDHLLRLLLAILTGDQLGTLVQGSLSEKIRNFLTNQTLTTILDAAYSVIYIVVMLYSWILTLVALMVAHSSCIDNIRRTIVGASSDRRQKKMPVHKLTLLKF